MHFFWSISFPPSPKWMACTGQKVLHTWQPMHVRLIKYILPGFAALASATFGSEVFAAAIELAASMNNGDAIATEPAIKNFRLVKSFLLILPPLKLNT
jgi:hypothetical protein